MTASTAELVQVRYQKLKNVSFEVMPITARQYHVHSSPEICLVLEGELTYTVNGATYLAGPGSLLLCNAYEVHCLEPQPSATVLFLHLAPGFGKDYFARMVNVEFDCDPTLITKAAHQQIVQPILAAATVYFGEPEAFGMECVGWICHAVTALLRNVPYRLNTDAEFLAKKKKIGRKQRIASFVEQHYREKLSLTQLAQEEGITTAYMSRIFAELFSDSFQEYLSKMRLQKAINLLKQSNIYLVDICMECGFSDTRYLNAICQKEYGCSAMALREKMQNPEWQDPHQEPEAAELTLDDAESLRILKLYIEKY